MRLMTKLKPVLSRLLLVSWFLATSGISDSQIMRSSYYFDADY